MLSDLIELAENNHPLLKAASVRRPSSIWPSRGETEEILLTLTVGRTNIFGLPFMCQAQPQANLTCYLMVIALLRLTYWLNVSREEF